MQRIGGRTYYDIKQKNQQIRCAECVFLTPDEKSSILQGNPLLRQKRFICALSMKPLGTKDDCWRKSCPKGKTPLV